MHGRNICRLQLGKRSPLLREGYFVKALGIGRFRIAKQFGSAQVLVHGMDDDIGKGFSWAS
ncbi:MAG: hypothetical protein IPN95_17555 [Bacteroidetes bacterium]|nr:hypothetical protein [Bacteroidota bacterium]